MVNSTVWKFLHHQVRIKIQGYGVEKLLSKLMNSGIPIKNIKYVDETEIYVTVTWDGYLQLKKLSGSTFKISRINEKGMELTKHRLKKNKLLFVGIILFVCYFIVQGMYIREIEITGLSSIPEKNVRQVLKDNGLYEGAFKNFSCKGIENKLFSIFDNIVYANVAYLGQYAKVEIAENRQMPGNLLDQNVSCDIIADKNGYIESISPYTGKKAVSVNDYVKAGDVLISGTIPIEYSTYQPTEEDPLYYYVHAAGDITARVPYFYSFTIGKDNYKKLAKEKVNFWIKENIPENAQILNKSLNFIDKENIIRVYGIIETRQKIGIEKEILVDGSDGRIEKDSN